MTQEQKARAYDEALERAKDYYKANQKIGESDENEVLSDIFPELKESEEEKIRKTIIRFFKDQYSDETEMYDGSVTVGKAIAWLEKQGKPKWSEEDEKNRKMIINHLTQERGSLSNEDTADAITWLENQGKQKVSVVDFKAKDWYVSQVDGKIYNAKFMEKNPTNQARKLEIEKAAMSATGIIEQEEWFIKGAEWADAHP